MNKKVRLTKDQQTAIFLKKKKAAKLAKRNRKFNLRKA
jgi:hypothetical protein